MKILMLLSFLMFLSSAQAQSVKTQTTGENQNMSVNTDREPSFIKGEIALYRLVAEGIEFSEEAKAKAISGEVMLSFDVMPDSTVKNTEVISGPGYGIDQAVKAYVEKLKFIPAQQNGVLVRMNLIMNFPVRAH